jgi:hypothetical protein
MSPALSPADEAALAKAVQTLEHVDFAARVADITGEPITRAIRLMPASAARRLDRAVQTAVVNCLNTAIETLDDAPLSQPAKRRSAAFVGVTGGIGGAFGVLALPVELPVTTTIMLRSIADIARHEGEDLRDLGARLACLEVFALSSGGGALRGDVGYYATRAMIAKLTEDAIAQLLQRGAASTASPAVGALVSTIVNRFGLVVSDRLTASALPIIGAVGGATVNVLFINHFQSVAQAHFTVRRLERRHGPDAVRSRYDELAQRPKALGRKTGRVRFGRRPR